MDKRLINVAITIGAILAVWVGVAVYNKNNMVFPEDDLSKK